MAYPHRRQNAFVVLDATTRQRLRQLVDERGPNGAADVATVSVATLAKAIASIPLRPATAVLIQYRLGEHVRSSQKPPEPPEKAA